MKQILMILTLFLMISCGNSKFEILKEDVNMNVSRIDVKLYEKVDKSVLIQISNEIRASRKSYDKVWISFYLPDYLPESGISAWAMGNFTPELEIEIFGENNPSPTKKTVDFPKYSTIVEMLEASHDYEGHNLEIISKNPIHIRVSTEFVKGDLKQTMIEQTKRDIIYVAFQAFAETDINEIKITSIPIQRENFNPNLPYDGKKLNSLKQTKKITRAQAQMIIEKYLKIKSFKDLYQLNETIYMPNDKFSILKFGQLENVYNDLK